MAKKETILVTGATGHVGRVVVSNLLDRGAAVRALSRNPDGAKLPEAAHVVHGDLSNPSGMAAVLEGVDSIFLIWPLFATDTAPAFLDSIKNRVRNVVFLSAMGARDDQGTPVTFHGELELLLEDSGLTWTFIRSGGFATNTLMWAEQIRAGLVRWPYGEAARSLIHERDIGSVVAHVLTESGHDGATHVLTGPAAVTQIEQVRLIGEAIGKPVRWENLSREAGREQLLAAWGEPTFVEGALDHWANLVIEPEPVTHTVEKITGTPAHTFREWAIDHADDFARRL